MGLEAIPAEILNRYHVKELRHACAILAADCAAELADIVGCLQQFELLRSEIEEAGGGKGKIAARFDEFLAQRGWNEIKITVGGTLDQGEVEKEIQKLKLSKGRVALEVKWNNHDPFYSWNLSAFRLLHELGVISVGVIVTRIDQLQETSDELPPVWDEVEALGAGRCPLLLIGITAKSYRDDLAQGYNSSFSSKTLSS